MTFLRAVCAIAVSGAIAAACAGSDAVDAGYEEIPGDDTGAGRGGKGGESSHGMSSSTKASSSSSTGSTTAPASSSSGPSCQDTGTEPNESEATAVDLGRIGDPDGDGGSVTGVLNGPDDQDWFKYNGVDKNFSVVDPTRNITTTDGLRVCKFVQCQGAVVGCGSATAAQSPAGRPGCCHNQGFTFEELDCDGASDNATVFIRIDKPDAPCVPYKLDYHY